MRIRTRVESAWPQRRGLPQSLAVVCVLSFPFVAAADVPAAGKLVVVLYPQNDDGSPGHILADRGIRSTFASGPVGHVQVNAEYLDVSQRRGADDRQFQVEYLRRKYAGRKVDLVVAGLSSALDYALAHRAEVFPGVPIVFCAVDRRELGARKLPPDVVGVPISMDLAATLELALRLHPQTLRVYVVAGQSGMDATWMAEARREFQRYEGRLEVVSLAGLPLDDLLARVADLPDQSLIYYLHMFQDGTGRVTVPAQVLEQLAYKAKAPIYGHVDSYVGRGIVGGQVFSFEAAGRDAARIGLRILAGERPETIGVQGAADNAYLFDWRQLRRWGIGEDHLPPGSVVRNRELGFWDLYKWPAVGATAVCLVQALLIAGLLVQRSSRRRADRALYESERRFRLMADTAPVLVWMSGRDKRCTYFNKPWLDFTGQPLERELGDGWSAGVHPDDVRGCLNTYVRAFDARAAFRMEYRLRRFDGEYRWILDSGEPRLESDGTFNGYIGSCIDITDRKQVEQSLQESQQELRMLTGRLLVAQETERRRIARELHDDLSQGLALLAVELDLLSQTPAASDTSFAGQVQELSALVKHLSTSVHDLSHQLHPSKLEQLGLVAAVRSLCQELTLGHGLPIEFTHRDVPTAIPADTALCLYRIVQEALRNVLKHSGARHAGVELSGSADALGLAVVDDGTGFAPGSVDAKGGLGLVSMRERLHLVRGTMTLDSRPTGGTRIEVRVPWAPTGPAASALEEYPERQDGETADVPVPERQP